jgi:hypothetical protein
VDLSPGRDTARLFRLDRPDYQSRSPQMNLTRLLHRKPDASNRLQLLMVNNIRDNFFTDPVRVSDYQDGSLALVSPLRAGSGFLWLHVHCGADGIPVLCRRQTLWLNCQNIRSLDHPIPIQ